MNTICGAKSEIDHTDPDPARRGLTQHRHRDGHGQTQQSPRGHYQPIGQQQLLRHRRQDHGQANCRQDGRQHTH